MILKEITESELSANGVSALPTRPNAAREFGGRGYTPAQLKAAFDRLPRLVATRYNELVRQIEEGELSESLSVEVEGGCKSLQDAVTELYSDMSDVKTDLVGCATKAALAKSAVEYRDGTITVTVGGEEPYASGSAALPIPAMQRDIDTLYKIVSQTVVTDTEVEDTYTARVTAGGWKVADGAPTAVHKIQGATVASKNLLDESQILPWTLPATTPAEQTEYTRAMPLTISAGTYTLSTSIAGGVQVTNSLAVFLRDASGNTVVDCNTASVNASSAASAFTVTEEQAGLITDIYFYVNLSAAELLGQTVDWVMLSEGETASPHEAYYAGVKQAYFKGIVSTGRNLITSLVTQSFTSNGVTVTPDAENGTVTINGSPDGIAASGRISPNFYLPKGTYTLYTPHRTMRFVGWHIRDLNNQNAGKIDWAWSGGVISNTFTVTEAGYYYLYLYIPSGYGASFSNYVETPMVLPGAVTSDFPSFETYKSDVTFALNEAVQLGRWDCIDADRQKIVTGTAILTQETPFTDEQLGQYGDYVLSADRKTVAYAAETETETDIIIPTCYTAYRGGLETVEQGDTDNSAFGAENTVTQNYFVIAGGDEA